MCFTFASCLLPNTVESTGQMLTLTSFIRQPCNGKPIATREDAQLRLRTSPENSGAEEVMLERELVL